MSAPQEVKKKPTEAAKFEGGADEAKVILAWVESHDNEDTAVWYPAESGDDWKRAEKIDISYTRPLFVGMWVVYDGTYHSVYDDETFRKHYDTV